MTLLLHQDSLGIYTRKELSKLHGVSVSTIKRKLSEKQAETNRRCKRRWYYQGPLPKQVEKVCKWCFEFYHGPRLSKCCSEACKCEYAANRDFVMPIFKRELEQYFLEVGFSRETCRRLGLTEDEAKKILNE